MQTPQRICIIRDTYEPKEGPYWSSHVEVLSQGARTLSLPMIEADIEHCPHISNFDLILFRPTQNGELRRSFIQKITGLNGHWLNKSSSYPSSKIAFFTLAQNLGIPTPETWSEVQFRKQNIRNENGYVVKISTGSQGKGVFYCPTRKQALQKMRYLNTPVVVQEFIPLPTIEDIRLLMVGTTLCGAMKRVLKSETKNEFRANISLGTSVPLPYSPTQEILEYAQKIMIHTKLDFAGIDLIMHNNKPLFLECNTRPGLLGIRQTDAHIGTKAIQMILTRLMNLSQNS